MGEKDDNRWILFPALLSIDSALALLTLTALEVVLGIDNIVFIAILTGRLPEGSKAVRASSASCWQW